MITSAPAVTIEHINQNYTHTIVFPGSKALQLTSLNFEPTA